MRVITAYDEQLGHLKALVFNSDKGIEAKEIESSIEELEDSFEEKELIMAQVKFQATISLQIIFAIYFK